MYLSINTLERSRTFQVRYVLNCFLVSFCLYAALMPREYFEFLEYIEQIACADLNVTNGFLFPL